MTPDGSFKPTVMFFGLTSLSAMFQTMINKILWNLINTRKVASFINNIIIDMEIEEGCDELVEEVVKRLAKNNLYVKLEKCKWKVREVGFLGVMIRPKEIKIEEDKVRGVQDWLTPKYVKDVQKFLGLANYYYQFIKDFIFIARPLHDMVKKNQKQEQTERQKKAFRELKERLTKEPVLVALDSDKKNENGS